MLRQATFLLGTLLAAAASAQIMEMKTYHGKPVMCGRSGLIGAYNYCGTDGDYAYILTATIVSVENFPADNEQSAPDTWLRIQPNEIFRGAVDRELTVMTDAQQCLGDFRVGDKWLLFIHREKNGSLRFYYDSGSEPLDQADAVLPLLKLQAKTPHAGVIQGVVQVSDDPEIALDSFAWSTAQPEQRKPLENHQVLLHRDGQPDRSATTDSKGDFRFAALDPGEYTVDPNTTPDMWSDPQPVNVSPMSCAKVDRFLTTDGVLSGRWERSDHSAVAGKSLEAIMLNGPHPGGRLANLSRETETDGSGRFTFHGLPPGQYQIVYEGGINGDDKPTMYYPGTTHADHAVPIAIERGETRSDLTLICPKHAPNRVCPVSAD